jgi:hypothetical protein
MSRLTKQFDDEVAAVIDQVFEQIAADLPAAVVNDCLDDAETKLDCVLDLIETHMPAGVSDNVKSLLIEADSDEIGTHYLSSTMRRSR